MALNGLSVKGTAGDTDETKMNKLEESIRYIGVSIKDVVNCFDGSPNNDSPVAITSGYAGVTNTGQYTFHPGDIVCWKLPDPKTQQPIPEGQMEVAKSRKVLETVPFCDVKPGLLDADFDVFCKGMTTILANTDKEQKKKAAVVLCLAMASSRASHIVGVAQQSGKPGETFGVVISPPIRNVFSAMLSQFLK